MGIPVPLGFEGLQPYEQSTGRTGRPTDRPPDRSSGIKENVIPPTRAAATPQTSFVFGAGLCMPGRFACPDSHAGTAAATPYRSSESGIFAEGGYCSLKRLIEHRPGVPIGTL